MTPQPLPRFLPWLGRCLRLGAPAALSIAVVFETLIWFVPDMGESNAIMVAYIFLVHSLFRMVLVEPTIPPDPKSFSRHMGRFFLVTLGLGAACLPFLFALIVWLQGYGLGREEVALLGIGPFMLVLSVLLTLFGTLLPSAALGQPFSPRKALQAARKTWAAVAGQFLALLVYQAVRMGAFILLYYAFGAEDLAPLATLAVMIVASFLNLLDLVLVVAILARAHQRGWPEDPAPLHLAPNTHLGSDLSPLTPPAGEVRATAPAGPQSARQHWG